MTGTTVAAKIDRAMTKVSKKLGFTATIYRPDVYVNPLEARNIVFDDVQVAFSVDENFIKNPVDELDHYKLYVSKVNCEVGDIIDVSIGRTFIVTEMEPIRTPSGIMTNDRFDLFRVVPTVTEDVKMSTERVAQQVPCALKFGRSQSVTLTGVNQRSGQSNVEVWTWMPATQVKLDDVLQISSSRYRVTSVDSSSKGTKLSATSVVPGK